MTRGAADVSTQCTCGENSIVFELNAVKQIACSWKLHKAGVSCESSEVYNWTSTNVTRNMGADKQTSSGYEKKTFKFGLSGKRRRRQIWFPASWKSFGRFLTLLTAWGQISEGQSLWSSSGETPKLREIFAQFGRMLSCHLAYHRFGCADSHLKHVVMTWLKMQRATLTNREGQ